jgi:hypothetical protein
VNASSLQLLKLLGSGVRPGSLPAAAPNAAGQTAFADLLSRAKDGSLASAAPVTIAGDAGVSCSDDQLARLSLGADRLEAAGVRTALVNIDGQKLILDVHARSITGRASGADGIVSGVDGVIDLGDARSAVASALNPPGAGIAPGAGSAGATAGPGVLSTQSPSLLKLLAGLSPA